MHLSLGMNNKLIRGAALLFVCCILSLCLLPFSPTASAATTGSLTYFSNNYYFMGSSQSESPIYGSVVLSCLPAAYLPDVQDGTADYGFEIRVLGIVTIHNQSDQGWLSDNTLFRLQVTPSNANNSNNNYQLVDIEYIGGYLKPSGLTSAGSIALSPISSDNAQSRLFAISPKSSVSSVFELVYHIYDLDGQIGFLSPDPPTYTSSSVKFTYPTTVTGTFGDYVTTNVDYIPSIYEGLVDMNGNITAQFNALIQYLESINKPANAPDVTDQSQDQLDIIEQQHTNEQSYFQQNEQNLQATGISNFQFDGDQVNSLTALTTDFTSLWNALGEWKFIYLFTLMISLATFLIRHRSQSSGIRTSDKGSSHG